MGFVELSERFKKIRPASFAKVLLKNGWDRKYLIEQFWDEIDFKYKENDAFRDIVAKNQEFLAEQLADDLTR